MVNGRRLCTLAAPMAIFALSACHAYTIPGNWHQVELERVRVHFTPARSMMLQAWRGDSVAVLVRYVEGRVVGIRGDTLDLQFTNAVEDNGNYLRAVSTDQRVRVVADANARVQVRHTSAVRNILLVGIPTAAIAVYVWLLSQG